MPLLQVLRPTLPILIGASIMLTLSRGLRQSLGIFMQPLTHDIHLSVSDFTLALAVQNLAWGFLQPLAGAMTVRYGFRPIMIVGSFMYIAGLILMATANGCGRSLRAIRSRFPVTGQSPQSNKARYLPVDRMPEHYQCYLPLPVPLPTIRRQPPQDIRTGCHQASGIMIRATSASGKLHVSAR